MGSALKFEKVLSGSIRVTRNAEVLGYIRGNCFNSCDYARSFYAVDLEQIISKLQEFEMEVEKEKQPTYECNFCGKKKYGLDPPKDWIIGKDDTRRFWLCKECRTIGNALKKQEGGSHYKDFAIQPIEFINRNDLGFIEGNVIKYVCRYKEKGGEEDIKKAIHYLQMLLEMKYGQT